MEEPTFVRYLSYNFYRFCSFFSKTREYCKKLATYVVLGVNEDGIKEAIATAFLDTEYQRCIVHQVRKTLKYVSYKDRKAFASDLRTIYHAPNEEIGYERMQDVSKKWEPCYPDSMKSWEKNWDLLCPIYKFSPDVRKVIYTTNAIESLNSTYKKLNSQRSVFLNEQSFLKLQKNGNFPLEIWGKSTVNFRLCTRGG